MRLAASIASSVTASLALVGSLAAPARAESPSPGYSQNECYTDTSGPPAFLPGLVAGDIIAARLRSSGSAVIGLEILFGGIAPSGDTLDVTVKIWDDTAETAEPGAELYSGVHELGSHAYLQPIPLAGVQVPERFRVGIVLPRNVLPSIGYDLDGTIATDNNFVFTAADGWHTSAADGATGDWIIRAVLPGGGDFGVCPSEGGGGGGGGGDAAFGTDANGGDGDGTGCCQSSHRGGATSAVLGLGVLALMLRRRRRS